MTRPIWNEGVTWQDQGLCRGANPDLFFTPHHLEKKEERAAREAQAKAVCARCPVLDACRDFALSVKEPHGVWGGLNEIERRHILTKRVG